VRDNPRRARSTRMWLLAAAAVAVLALPAAGVATPAQVPTAIGAGEGKLTLVAWEGYAEQQWVAPFERSTGCKVQATYAGSSDEMVNLMRADGGSRYDMVSASGEASLRLIYGKDVAEINVALVPSWKDFYAAFKSPPSNTLKGKHYGISVQFGLNLLLYNTEKTAKPTTWGVLYDPANKGLISVPDNPIQIADAALYLSKTKPELKITDPYELNQKQFDAAVNLLKQQRPLLKKHWSLASDEIDLFKNGDATLGASWPYQVSTLTAAKIPVASVIPKEGVTGWLDSWMIAAKAKHPNCAYKWLRWVSTPKVQAQQAVSYGETPVNKKACPVMENLAKGSCAQFFASGSESYYRSIKFWKTPIATCPNGKSACMDYQKWVQAWTQIRG
jgi:putative spermidine/putrescine transport system substrate-binding protein